MIIISLLLIVIGLIQLFIAIHVIKESDWIIKKLGWKKIFSYQMQIDKVYYTASSFLFAGIILWMVS